MLTSVDACYPQNMAEGGHDVYLSYCDGICAFRPNPLNRPVRYIISSLATNQGVIGDVEPGNPWWDRWVPWVQQRRAAGKDPTLYCCDDGFGSNYFDGWRHADGVAAFARAGVPEPHWWIFNFNKSYVPAYAVANQVSDNIGPGWDLSLVQDHGWPGVIDPPQEEDMPVIIQSPGGTFYLLSGGLYVHITDQASLTAFQAANLPQVTVTDAQHQAFLASQPKLTGTVSLKGTADISGTVTAS